LLADHETRFAEHPILAPLRDRATPPSTALYAEVAAALAAHGIYLRLTGDCGWSSARYAAMLRAALTAA
jgi:hypothetical protein